MALIRTMPNTEITEECRALIASIFEPPPGQRLPNGNWRIEIDAATRGPQIPFRQCKLPGIAVAFDQVSQTAAMRAGR